MCPDGNECHEKSDPENGQKISLEIINPLMKQKNIQKYSAEHFHIPEIGRT